MSQDDEDFPDIIDFDPEINPDEIIDDEDDEHWEKARKKLTQYIKKNRITLKTCKRHKNARIRELRKIAKDLTMLVYAEAYQSRETYSGFINKQDALRRGIFKALLKGLCIDGKIIVVQDLLRELEGDTEPTGFYIW